jgi:hypothetical protein
MVRRSLVTLTNLFVAALLALLLLGAQAHRVVAQENDVPVRCQIGIYLLSLTNFDLPNNLFDINSYLWSNCPAESYAPFANADFINAKSASINNIQTWNSDGVDVESGRLVGTFQHNWNVRNFPFDRHTLEILLEPDEGDIEAIVFEPDFRNSGYQPDLRLDGWRLTDLRFEMVESHYASNLGEPAASGATLTFSRLRILMQIERTEIFSFFSLTAPVYITFLVTLLSFLLYITGVDVLATQLGILSGGLFATIVSMNSARAALGNDLTLTLLDQIHIVVLLYILVELALAIYFQVALKQGWTEGAVKRLNYRFLAMAALTFIVINAILIGVARIAG